jgi:putative nucleotidyltransferase with HDIG domain
LIALSSTLGVLSLERTERLNAFWFAGMVAGFAGGCVGLVFEFDAGAKSSLFEIVIHFFSAVAGGFLFSTGLSFVGLYLITYFMNIPTSLKLFELTQANHPLLQRLLREAPGTYQHSLQVANLAELGGQQVNANASLLRVAAMYHDVGKILNPHFFVENQADGVNPHDQLDDPCQSARIIIGHVHEGERLSRHYRLPPRIRDFILEHHGTTQVMFFYRQALERAQKKGVEADINQFTYPGPRPQSRETAILMLADGCESSVRARRPQSKQDIQETVDFIFETRLKEHQLDDSGLTLNDLRILRDAFLTALQGVFHPRIAYPGTPGQQTPELPPAESVRLLTAKQTGEMAQVKVRQD